MSSNGGNFNNGNDKTDTDGDQTPSLQNSKIHESPSITPDESSDSYIATMPTNDEVSLGLLIVRAVARITQTDPLELEPLGETLDVTSLHNLFESFDNLNANTGTPPMFTFEYAECKITVESPTQVKISP